MGCDLQSEHERYLSEVHVEDRNLIDYPKDIKAFYMKQNPDGKTVAAMDVLFPRLGEIVGGSQREDDGDPCAFDTEKDFRRNLPVVSGTQAF